MVVLAHFNDSNEHKKVPKGKIPEYAKDFKKEYLFIRGINKSFDKFYLSIKSEEEFAEVFDSGLAKFLKQAMKEFLKAQEPGKFKDTSKFYFEHGDTYGIDNFEESLYDYMDIYRDPFSFEFDQKRYENEYPSLREFYELFTSFKKKININEMTYSEFMDGVGCSVTFSDSDYSDSESSESDSDSESD